jgi:hypothetical protein
MDIVRVIIYKIIFKIFLYRLIIVDIVHDYFCKNIENILLVGNPSGFAHHTTPPTF